MDALDRLRIDVERWSRVRTRINTRNDEKAEGAKHLRNDTLTQMSVVLRVINRHTDSSPTIPHEIIMRKAINDALKETV